MNYISLNKSFSTPLYKQIVESIHSAIQRGDLKDMDPLPYEEDIARFYDISRVSVRMAYQTLVDQGLIVRVKRRGTSVRLRPRILFKDNEVLDVYQLLSTRGFTISERVLLWDDAAFNRERVPMCLRNASQLTHCSLVIEANGLPFALVDVYVAQPFSHSQVVQITEAPRILYALKAFLAHTPTKAHIDFQYRTLPNLELQTLRLPNDALITQFHVQCLDENDRCVMCYTLHISGQHNVQTYLKRVAQP
jgi:DNA-binding GntR family transcriptional regulator